MNLGPAASNTFVVKVVHPGHAIPSFPDFSYRDVAATLQDMFGYPVGELPIAEPAVPGSKATQDIEPAAQCGDELAIRLACRDCFTRVNPHTRHEI